MSNQTKQKVMEAAYRFCIRHNIDMSAFVGASGFPNPLLALEFFVYEKNNYHLHPLWRRILKRIERRTQS